MLTRKVIDFVITSVLSPILLTALMLTMENYEFLETFGFILLFAVPCILLLGVPISILSDYLTKGFDEKKRRKYSLYVHLIIGVGIILFYGLLMAANELLTDFSNYWADIQFYFYSSTIISFLFWAVDEVVRKKRKDKEKDKVFLS